MHLLVAEHIFNLQSKTNMFTNESVDLPTLKKRAFNLRWAAVPEGTIPLTAADPDFPIATPIREAVAKYAMEGYFSYGAPEGLKELREALSQKYVMKNDCFYDPSHILPVDSAAFAVQLACKTFLNPWDEAIVFDPVDYLFRYSIESVNAVAIPFEVPTHHDELDFSHMEMFISPRTKMICLCNPLNPTGKVFSKKELQQIGEIAIRHNLIILSDEIWSDIIFKPNTYTSIASLDEEIRSRTITITGFSKSYGLASLRVGALLLPNERMFKKIFKTSLHRSTVHGCNVAGQIAAATALNECDTWLESFIEHLHQMRRICTDGLNAIPGIRCYEPQGCYVAFADITGTGLNSDEMHHHLLNQAKVAVVPGLRQWFGEQAEGHIRLSFATSESILTEAIDRIRKSLI